MQQIKSRVLLYTTLLVLASFLVFWLYEEYQDEKKSMQTEIYLNVADQVIQHNGGDLSLIIKEFNNKNFDIVGDLMLDSIFQHGSSVKVRYMTSNDSGHPNLLMPHMIDSLLHKQIQGLGHGKKNKAILFSDRIRFSSLDTGAAIFGKTPLPEEFYGLTLEKDHLSKNALQNIIPQILFAICLFGLLGLGIFFLENAFKKQQHFLESKNNFLGNMAHELKTPIATISVALEVLQNYNGQEDKVKSEKYLTQSRKELARLSQTIDEVMQVSKIDSNNQIYQFQETNINQICQAVTDNLSIRLEQKNIDLVTNFLKENVVAEIDPRHFENMLFNLLDNAIKYGKEGGKIKIELDQNKQKFYLAIADSGIGIAGDQKEKIFERFYRIANGNTHDVKGTGLGLSYVKQVVDTHHGKIKVNSQIGKGSTFNISIPLVHV